MRMADRYETDLYIACGSGADYSDRNRCDLGDLQAGKYLESDVGRADRKCVFFPAALYGALL